MPPRTRTGDVGPLATPDPSPPADPVAPPLLPGAESSDPAVQQLLAERVTVVQNGDDEAARRVTAALAELGYR